MELIGKVAKQVGKGRFTPEDVALNFDATWLDELTCRSWVMLRLHRSGAGCPGCGAPITPGQRESFFGQKRVKCSACGKYFNARSATFLSGSKLDYRQIVLMNYLIGIGVNDAVIASALNVDRTTVWDYRKRVGING